MVQLWIKRAAIFFTIIAFLIIGFVLFLHTATGKLMVRNKVQAYLQEKWQTSVWIGNIDYRLPNWISLEQVIILDQKKDTLLSGGRLYVGIKLLKLLANTVDITEVNLEAINLNCRRLKEDSVFNFQFIFNTFAPSPKNESTQRKSAPIQLSANRLTFNKVRLNFRDQKQQFYFSAFINELTCQPASLNTQRNTYRFTTFLMRNSQVIIVDSSTKNNASQKNTKSRGDPASLQVALNALHLQNVSFSYRQPRSKTNYSLRIDSLNLQQASVDLSEYIASARSMRLSNSAVHMNIWSHKQKASKKVQQLSSTAAQKKWTFRIDTISLRQNSFSYHNAAVPAASGLDFQHVNLKNINLQTIKSSLDDSGFFSEVEALSLNFNNKIYVKSIRAGIYFSDSLVRIQNLIAAINQSKLKTHGAIVWSFNSYYPFYNTPQFLIENSSIQYSDLLLFQPELKKQLPVSLLPSEKILLSGIFSGTLQNLTAKQISLASSNQQFELKGNINFHLAKAGPDIYATLYQLQFKKQLLSDKLLQRLQNGKIDLPNEMALTGKVQVNAQRLKTDLQLNSAFGRLVVTGRVDNIRFPQQLAYNITLEANNLETGRWIGLQSVLGKITGRIFIRGRGIQENNRIAAAQLHLRSAVIKGYPLSNINLQASLERSAFAIQSNIKDPNLQTSLDLIGRIGSDRLLSGRIHVQRADLSKLGLTAESLVYAGKLRVKAHYQQPYSVNVFIQADSNRIFVRGKQLATDSLLLQGQADAHSMKIAVRSPFLEAQLTGNYPLHELSVELVSIWKELYPLYDTQLQKKPARSTPSNRTSLDIKVIQDSVLLAFLPKLQLKQPVTVHGTYNGKHNDSFLSVQLLAPDVRYKQYTGQDLQVTVGVTDSVVQFSIRSNELLNGKTRLFDARIAGQMQKDLLLINGQVNDSTGKEYYSARLEVKNKKDETTIRFLDDLTLNRNKWKVPADNLIRIGKQGYIINHLLLENRGQAISFHTKDQQVLSPIDIRIDRFDIGNIFNFLSLGDTLLGAKGVLNADISIQQPIGKVPVVTGDIHATDLSLLNIPVGNLQFHSSSMGDSLTLKGGLSGVNQLDFNGHMHLTNGGIELQARLEKLNTNMVQLLAKDIFSQLSGNITGTMQVTGTLDTPRYAGAIYLDSVALAVKELNTIYRVDKQKLVIDYPDLHFDQFALSDSAGHLLTIRGKAPVFSPGERKLDINVAAKDFMVLNAARQPGNSLYGVGIIDANVTVKGTFKEPIVEGNAYLQTKSQVHFVSNPRRNVAKSRKNGIIFVNIDTLAFHESEMAQPLNDSAIARTSFKGLKYNLDLKVDKDAEFSIIVDPAANDEMVLKGAARLNAGLGENGNIGLEGVYNLQSGYYKMNNLLLRGKFLMVKGSSISFNGDPALAEADVTTEYVIEASPKGLLNYQDDDNAAYSQRIPFAVIFMIKGPVSKPTLSFDIQIKEGKAVLKSSVKSDVEHALDRLRSDVTEMNKQVFSLLLTKRFASTTADNTLESSNLNANNALKEGVSSFVTEAMNQVADQLIKGVDIDVNMKTYKAEDDPISKTDLGVAMSKDLLQDRLVIRIEESFAVGHSSNPAKSGSQYVPDITSIYKLSKDGRFQVKGYQKNEYDAVVQGYFTEVGVSFAIEMSYDTFKEMIRRRKHMANEKK